MLQEGITNDPDETVSLLQAALANASFPTPDAKAKVLGEKILLWGWDAEGDLVSPSQMIQEAMMGLWPERHSDLVRHCPSELVLRVKHKVLSEEKGSGQAPA